MSTHSLSEFVHDRIDEHPDQAEADTLRELWNVAHDQIDVTPPPPGYGMKGLPSFTRVKFMQDIPRQYLPGQVKNERALRELAQRWRDHPDFRKEWQ